MCRYHWKLLLIVSIFLTSVISAPFTEKIKSQLRQKGFGNGIVSSDNFQRSLTCVKCGTCLTFGPGQGPWTLKRYAGLESHKTRAVWTINESYDVVSLRQSGKSYYHITLTWRCSSLIVGQIRRIISFSGRPSHLTKISSSMTIYHFSKVAEL